jgi:signal transduction histidine kinase
MKGCVSSERQMTSLPNPSQEAFYRQLVDRLPVGMAVIHLQDPRDARTWKAIAVNSMASETIGSSAEDFLFIPTLVRNNDLDWVNTAQLYASILSSGISKVLGHVSQGEGLSSKRICSVTAFPLAGNCLGLLVQDETHWRDTHSELLEAQLRLRQLSSSLLRLQDQERKQISRELHDSIGQHLTGIKLRLEVLKRAQSSMDERLQETVTECMDILINCMTEVRNVCNLLHPAMLEDLGLASALRSLVEGFSRPGGPQLHLDVPEKIEGLSSEVQLTLFRVVQECIANVYKHAHSDSATIRFARDNGHIRLQVEDHGIGFSPAGVQPGGSVPRDKGLGIRGMRERIHELGGNLEITSNGHGTTVRIAIPNHPSLVAGQGR